MALAQLFLNSFPFVCCLFIVFFGRMFSHVLRALMVFLVVTCPLLGYIILGKRSFSAGLLSGDEASLNVNATYVVAIVWALWASVSTVYVCMKRGGLGKKVESGGIGFLLTMTASSFYMGSLHRDVVKERPGVVAYMEWLSFLAVVAISSGIHFVRKFPGMKDVSESAIHAYFGTFMALQFFASMGLEYTEGLQWRRIITHEFGCANSSCIFTVTVFGVLGVLGAVVQTTVFKAGRKDNAFKGKGWSHTRWVTVLGDMLTSLKNINSVLQSYSYEAEAASDPESLRNLRLTLSEDVYKTIGGVSDVLLLTFALGLDAACVEMVIKDAYTTFGEDAFGYGVWLMLYALVATAIAGFTFHIRIDPSPVQSDTWKQNRHRLLLVVCMVWPFMIASALFSMTVGGEEVAMVDVPVINQQFGFHLLPMGCSSLNDEAPVVVDERETAAWKLEHAEEMMLANNSWWDGEDCHDGLLNNDEENVDCGGSCNRKCFDCQCHWSRVGTQQVEAGTGFPNAVFVERFDAFQGNATAYGDDSYCWSGARDANGNGVRYCYTTGGTNCTTALRPDVLDSTHEGFDWLDPRDTIRPCTRLEIAEVDSGILLPSATYSDCPVPPPPPPPPRRLWYCSAISRQETTRCFDCNTEGVGWDTAVCGFPTGVTCNDVKWLHGELPTIVKLVWGVAITSMVSALSGSGSLGGTYLLINKLTTYLTFLNFIQGSVIALAAKALSSTTGDALEDFGGAVKDVSSIGEQLETAKIEDLEAQLQSPSLWKLLIWTGVLMVVQSMLGLCGFCRSNSAHGGILLRVYLVLVLVSLGISCCLFGAAVYFAFNIDEIADDYWDVLIAPQLQLTNTSLISHDFSNMQKHEFIELARGSFRCLILIGSWIAGVLLATGIGTYYTVTRRKSAAADHARQRKKGAVANPMWAAQTQEDDMNSPLTRDVDGLVAGAVLGGALGVAAVATGAVGSVADMVLVESEEDDEDEEED